MKNVDLYLHRQSRPFWLGCGLVLIVIISLISYLIGSVSLSFFYVIPIFLVTWFAGETWGMASFVATVVTSIWAVLVNDQPGFPWAQFGRLGLELTSIFVVTVLLVFLKRLITSQSELTRIDNLTGAVNERYFTELANIEIKRAKRYTHPFTVAYVEMVNASNNGDAYATGIDKTQLWTLAQTLQNSIRTTDIVARVQDEGFALLLPDTGKNSAKIVLDKIRERTTFLNGQNDQPLIIKMGALTFADPPSSVDEMLVKTNTLIHSVRTSQHTVFRHETTGNC